MRKQLSLFSFSTKQKKEVYADLCIHKKINYKANECGLHCVLLSFYNYYNMPLYQSKKNSLTDKYFWHYKTNAGSENRYKKNKMQLF